MFERYSASDMSLVVICAIKRCFKCTYMVWISDSKANIGALISLSSIFVYNSHHKVLMDPETLRKKEGRFISFP